MLLLDLTHTSHTRARTGIQRVARSLYAALGSRALAVTHDPYGRHWRSLAGWESDQLSHVGTPAQKRSAQWPLRARIAGRWRRLIGPAATLPIAEGLIVPEIFSATVAGALPALFSQVKGPRVALFHDAIALRFPELSPGKTVGRFPAYLQELLAFDGIAAISEDSRQTLVDYWAWLGAKNPPPVIALTLGLDAPGPTNSTAPVHPTRPVVLSVGTIEGRKNHLALIEACEQLWARGLDFELLLIGTAHPQTGRSAMEKIADLQSAGRPLRYAGPVDDDRLEAAYQGCAFTVYPSLMEGFGLPVLESLARGKPCICSARGALGESTRGGGCLALDSVDSGALADAIARLLTQPDTLGTLAGAARRRVFKNWTGYATELTAWMQTLPLRPR